MMTRLKLVALSTLALSSLIPLEPAAAALFSKADLDPGKLALIASPYGNNAHQLLIVEQVANSRACWSERGTSPTVVEPLLADFDFTGICGRSTDANGYSIRMGDQDLGLQYSLRVVQRKGDLLLVGVSNRDRTAPEIPIGRAGGVTNGFAKLYLNPGWRITRRVYNNQALGHFYITNDQPLNSAIAAAPAPVQLPAPRPLPVPQPALPSVSRPEIVITPGSGTPSLFPRPASTSIPIPVPPPETASTTGSTRPAVRPLPLPTPSAAIPTTIPVSKPKTPAPSALKQPVTSGRSPITGKPIRVPLPAVATQPIRTAPKEAMQPPVVPATVTRLPVTQPPTIQPSVTQPPATQSRPAPSPTKPSVVKPGDFVVPTTAL
ncbi:MAG: DUF3747 domain-containing protein [Tildeniella nuda ZEHNDER 1965/U140]|nr:DUF3747 domain-containing protein [Tildeniella nuda ZEHNDER 1965/U140]